MSQERIIEKIKRCLALSKSSNENEAAMALRQAHAMMAKYQISMNDINLSDVTNAQSDETIPAKPMVYQIILAKVIAEKFGCEVYSKYNFEKGKYVLSFIGIDLYSTIASYAFDVLYRQLKQARRDYMAKHLSRVRIRKNKTARADVFCEGWVHSVAKLVDNLVPPSVDKKLIELKMSGLSVKSQNAVDRSKQAPQGTGHRDYIFGRHKGNQAQLHNAMNGSEQTMLEMQ